MGEAVEGTGSESGSLSEHEAQFHRSAQLPLEDAAENPEPAVSKAEATTEPEAEETPQQKEARSRDESGKFTKNRGKQQASPEDVPRIRELTKKLREAEERAADFERRYAESRPSLGRGQSEAPRSIESARGPVDGGAATFSEAEPTIEQFANEADPYAAWIRAVNRWDRKKEAFEADQQRLEGERKRVEAEGQTYANTKRQEYAQKADEFAASHADFNDLISQYSDWNLPPLANATILEHENGPQLVYNLLKQPEELAGLILLTDGKPVNEQTVALATRWLEKRALDGNTGSSAPVPQRKPTPTPPNPVRTVPSGSSESSDDDGMSLSDHERKYGRKRR